MADELSFRIRIIDATKSGLTAASSAIKSWAHNAVAGVKSAWHGVGTVFDFLKSAFKKFTIGAGVAFGALAYTIKEAIRQETIIAQFEVLYKSADKAIKKMEELEAFAIGKPFNVDQFATAAQMLLRFSQGALDALDTLTMLGDAAKSSNQSVEELAGIYGKLYTAAKNGRPIERMANALQQMGIGTEESYKKLDKLSGRAKNFATIMEIVDGELLKAKGSMEVFAKTGAGRWLELTKAWSKSLETFGMELLDFAKDDLKMLSDTLLGLIRDGSFTKWGKTTLVWLKAVQEKLKPIIKDVKDLFSEDPKVREAAAADLGKRLSDAAGKIGELIAKGIADNAKPIGEIIAAVMKVAWEGIKGGAKGAYGAAYEAAPVKTTVVTGAVILAAIGILWKKIIGWIFARTIAAATAAALGGTAAGAAAPVVTGFAAVETAAITTAAAATAAAASLGLLVSGIVAYLALGAAIYALTRTMISARKAVVQWGESERQLKKQEEDYPLLQEDPEMRQYRRRIRDALVEKYRAGGGSEKERDIMSRYVKLPGETQYYTSIGILTVLKEIASGTNNNGVLLTGVKNGLGAQ